MDESHLIVNAQKGDVTAFNELILKYQEVAYNVAYRILFDPPAAEDATQEAFISAYRSLNSFRGGSFKSWLLRIITNQCYDQLRHQKRRPHSSLEALTEGNQEAVFVRSQEPTPEMYSVQNDLTTAIEQCLEALPPDQRVVAVLCDVEGYDYQEIAEMASISLGTVKSRLSRARERLRTCLQGVMELLPAQYRLNS